MLTVKLILLVLFLFGIGNNNVTGFKRDVKPDVRALLKPPHFKTNSDTKSLTTKTSSRTNSYSCGVPVIGGNRIVGGVEATSGEWPWQVALFRSVYFSSLFRICGGSLVNNRWVVSAAHCTEGYTKYDFIVRLGEYDFNTPSTNARNYLVSSLIQHPDYNSFTLVNDIVLLQLASEIQYNDYILPICLPTPNQDVPSGNLCWITGWGNTENPSESQDILREAQVPIIENSLCDQAYSSSFSENAHVCAGNFTHGGTDTCQGDSGGPLQCQVSTSPAFTLEGITSFGIGCADPGYPGVYTRVSSYVDFINLYINGTDDIFTSPSTPCGTEITSNQTVGLPVDNETQLYEANANCSWIIRGDPTNSTTVTISFEREFAIESYSSLCAQDVLQFITPSYIRNLCGYYQPNDFSFELQPGETATVLFTSNSYLEYNGFVMNVTQTLTASPILTNNTNDFDLSNFYDIPETPCGSNISINSTLRLPVDATGFYVNNFNCSWNLETNGRSLIISFVEHFAVEPSGSTCLFDFVAIILLPTNQRIGDILCGFSLPNDTVIPSGPHTGVQIYFESDFIVRYEGFAVSVSFDVDAGNATLPPVSPFDIIPQGSCGSNFSSNTTIRLPVNIVTGLYQHNLDCNWYFITNGESLIIDFVELFAVEPSWLSCNNDYVAIYLQPSGVLYGSLLCGFTLPNDVIVPSGNHSGVRLLFHSNFFIAYQGFAVSVIFDVPTGNATLPPPIITTPAPFDSFFSIPERMCGSIITTNDSFRLPLNPLTSTYYSSFSCDWYVDSGGLNTYIDFIERFEVESNLFGCYDYVQVFVGGTSITGELCGNSLPSSISIPGGSTGLIRIAFRSDSIISLVGFAVNISFSSQYISTTPYTTTESDLLSFFFQIPERPCGLQIFANETFRLPLGFNQTYLNNFECNWTIPLEGVETVQITFVEHFSVEFSTGCYKDSVGVYLTPSDEQVETFCGATLPPGPISIEASSNENAVIVFRSDDDIASQGFAVQVEILESGAFPLLAQSKILLLILSITINYVLA